MTTILAISDTHITPGRGLPLDLTNLITSFDMVIHAGDIASLDALYEMRALRPTTAVYGNCDGWEIRNAVGRVATLAVDGVRIGVVHGDGAGGSTQSRARDSFPPGSVDLIVFGHSHQPIDTGDDGVRMLNPGSILRPRFQPRPSYGVIKVNDGVVETSIHHT